jgi:hypothetical protein
MQEKPTTISVDELLCSTNGSAVIPNWLQITTQKLDMSERNDVK